MQKNWNWKRWREIFLSANFILFKRIFGTTIGEYILKQRISQAKSLLRFSDLSIDEIAARCGFADGGYFIKVFKKEEKITPAKYRKLWQAS